MVSEWVKARRPCLPGMPQCTSPWYALKANLLWTVDPPDIMGRHSSYGATRLLTWYNCYWINNACKHHVQEHSQAENGENWPGLTYKKLMAFFFHSKIFSDALVWPAKLVNKKSCQSEGFLCWHLYLCDIWRVLFNPNRISVVFVASILSHAGRVGSPAIAPKHKILLPRTQALEIKTWLLQKLLNDRSWLAWTATICEKNTLTNGQMDATGCIWYIPTLTWAWLELFRVKSQCEMVLAQA